MTEITVGVKDEVSAQALLKILISLDFVEEISTNTHMQNNEADVEADFFQLVGLWKDRDISAETIRKNAWPRQAQ